MDCRAGETCRDFLKGVAKQLQRVGFLSFVASTAALAQTNELDSSDLPPPSIAELKKLSLEELMGMEVTSVSKRPEKLSSAPAAIAVITQEDIRRAGAQTIPDAMRLATGFEVARIDAHRFAITARGFNGEFADKLLVLTDERQIYSPVFSGVLWDQQNILMDDVERIEAIRGPGSTLWGANAVNGVINVITKNARDTQGTLISGGGGSRDHWFGSVRYGDAVGSNVFFRIYGTTFEHGEDDAFAGDWQNSQGGFRLDYFLSDADLITFQGDGFDGTARETDQIPTLTPPSFSQIVDNHIHYTGGNFIGRWTHTWSEDSQSELLGYWDNYSRSTLGFERQNTADFEFQHQFMLGERQNIVAGVGYRVTFDETGPGVLAFSPPDRTMQIFDSFVQDEISIVPDTLNFTVGSKFQHHYFTGFDAQPSGRFAWTPTPSQTIWGAISHAVRTPSRIEHDVDSIFATANVDGTPVFIRGIGNPEIGAEELLAFELGYRAEPLDKVTVDLAAYYNKYDDLVSQLPTTFNGSVTPPVQSVTFVNGLHGYTYGLEMGLQWRPVDWWTLRPTYTFLEMDIRSNRGTRDTATARLIEGQSPQNQFLLLSSMDLPKNCTFDFWLRYVDQLSSLGIPSYVTANIRFAWRPRKNLELSIVGQNLFEKNHPEFFEAVLGVPGQPAEISRGVYAKLVWEF